VAFSPTPSAALRYWNMARQRYCRRLVRYRNTLRVSADPVAKAAAHTRAESRGSRPSKPDARERQTLRWRGMDSNFRYRGRRLASGRSLRAQRVETDPAKGSSDQLLVCAGLRRKWSARRPVLSVCCPPGRAAREPAGADRASSCSSSSGRSAYGSDIRTLARAWRRRSWPSITVVRCRARPCAVG
jgi:hypothetical protein